ISFRTASGLVRAVRGVSFDLYEGETLAIVGESGSGKSVTTRATMGILAGNAVVESGEIFYGGKNLLQTPEEEMYKIRGDKIAMIFQDPTSALDPIMRVGKQITEGMILKNKMRRKEGKRQFKALFHRLKSETLALLNEEERADGKRVFRRFKRSLKRKEEGGQTDELVGVLKVRLQKDGESERAVEELKKLFLQSRTKTDKKTAKERAIRLMQEVGIPQAELRFTQYPFEFSGGMRQRIVIAIALAGNPEVLICDEPTTALDVSVQAQILELIQRLKDERKLSVVFITHDLGVVASVADRIAVMYAGKIVEYGKAEEIFYEPKHPYTWALLCANPRPDTNAKRLYAIPGSPPNMVCPPSGDAFAERNEYALKIDYEQAPPFFQVSETHYAATWLLHPSAPTVEPPEEIQKLMKKAKRRKGS
ncbi:MAG: ATP-binding cassette domain-containing protein, partial [Clostridia bacterium]|nr:ATP-binding cassette domain-containing protein [Clostridia bacterium]